MASTLPAEMCKARRITTQRSTADRDELSQVTMAL